MDTSGADPTPSLAAALAAVERLERTVENLLALARNNRCDVEPIDVDEVLDELRHDWHRRPTTVQRPLHIRVDPDLPPCVASGTAVRQVLAVLLDNAAAHSDGAVGVTARDASEVLAIHVSDHGVTVPETALFARRADTAGGHGVGLSLARTLAEAEGGRLRLTYARPPPSRCFFPQLTGIRRVRTRVTDPANGNRAHAR